jgi:peptide deformylase
MALLPIIIAPDPRLKTIAEPVPQVNDEIRQLMDDMLETMYDAPGIGLAAPQVGSTKRVIVIDVQKSDKADEPEKGVWTANPIRMANPEIIEVSDYDNTYDEGCLSLPEYYAEVNRPETIRVRYLDENNELQEIGAEGLLATCVQHEIDHLDGILFVDHITALKRNMILRKLVKLKKQTEHKTA